LVLGLRLGVGRTPSGQAEQRVECKLQELARAIIERRPDLEGFFEE
jgi:hypothetical protein